MVKILEIIRRMDLSNVGFNFKMGESKRFKTKFGGILYFFFFSISFFFIYQLTKDFFDINIYNKVEIKIHSDNAPEINYHKEKFLLAFGVFFKNDTIIPKDLLNKYFIEEIELITYKLDKKINKKVKTKTPIKFEPCYYNNSEFKNFHGDLTQRQLEKFSNLKCFDDKLITIKGSIDDDEFSYFQYKIYFNLTTFLNEKMDFFDNIITRNNLKTSFRYIEKFLDFNDKDNPVKSYVNSFFETLDTSLAKTTEIYLKKILLKINKI